jgi:DNA adenine methylase
MKPFVKWAGGKRQLITKILKIIDLFKESADENFTFIEPFVGGGVVFLSLKHPRTIINDLNQELINAYKVIKDNPLELMDNLETYKKKYLQNKENFYYKIRRQDRNKKLYNSMTDLAKATRTIFLNKTCYNGLYRVNLKGEFNTPMGGYVNPSIYDKNNILKLSLFFNNEDFKMLSLDYKEALVHVKKGDIIYVDPPYDYGNKNGFTKYLKEGFEFSDFKELKKELDYSINKGAFVIISNNATERVINLFKNDEKYSVLYNLKIVKTNRTINRDVKNRKSGKEVIIMGSPIIFPQADSVNKIMKLIRIRDIGRLNDVEDMKAFLDVTSYRQVHYYLMALRYLGLIQHDKTFSEKGLELRNVNRLAFPELLAKHILTKPTFDEVYSFEQQKKVKLDNLLIANIIKKEMPNYSYSTYLRRARTVRKWLDWCSDKLVKSQSSR